MIGISDLVDPSGYDKETYIRLVYRTLLQREVDEGSLQKLLLRENIQPLFGEVLNSQEFRAKSRNASYQPGLRLSSRQPRVLVVGGYGNGNLGDKIQADSLRHQIETLRPDIEVWASSAERGSFPFPFERVVPREELIHAAAVNQFDMVMIGGGGLLSHPHDPLTDPAWQAGVETQVAIVGVGANSDVIARCATLVKKASFVSVRDEHSMSAMRRFRPTASFLYDPVLCDSRYDSRAAASASGRPPGVRRLWILKPRPANLLPLYRQLIDPLRDEICFLEPHLDFPLLSEFPRARPIYRTDELLPLIDAAEVVVSARYHGCILAMLRDRPCIALYEHKSLDLFRRYGNERFFLRDLKDISFDVDQYGAPGAQLNADRVYFLDQLRGVLEKVGASKK